MSTATTPATARDALEEELPARVLGALLREDAHRLRTGAGGPVHGLRGSLAHDTVAVLRDHPVPSTGRARPGPTEEHLRPTAR
ncbi:hypothetical protein [Streptomyces sp. NPDC049585]|uniref:hypothetical protein n=1 Tax=Streptomyces sp. NPDC049585 TaxID=3155154 RepID=UPI003429090C